MDAYILDTVRTPRGRASSRGSLHTVRPLDLLTQLYQALEVRNPLDSADIDDVILGCATQTAEQGANIAKTSALLAGWGENVSGVTVNRFCVSGLEAILYGALKVDGGLDELVVAGGVESVSRVPMFGDNGPWYCDPDVGRATGYIHMGIAADLLASLEGFTRAELDAYGVQSHRRAAAARDAGRFVPSLVPIVDQDGRLLLEHDELIRADTTAEKLARFSPAFAEMGAQGVDERLLALYPQLSEVRHVHHRGNAPPLADAAGVTLLSSRRKAAELGLKPRARIRAIAHASADPVLMLTAGQEAIRRALVKAGLTVADVDLFEFAEAFAAVVLKLQRDLGIDPDQLNVNGGTIAMGHAFGATGALLLSTLLEEMERRDVAVGVVGISGAAGLGAAAVLERL